MATETLSLNPKLRDDRGKERARKHRQKSQIPAVIYGAGGDNIALIIDGKEFDTVRHKSHGESVLIGVNLPGGKRDNVFIREIQRDPVSRVPLHVDLLRVDMTKDITIRVALHSVGVPQGVKDGGLLEHVLREVMVKCLPDKVPSHINVDVSGLSIGHSVHVRELPKIEGVAYVSDPGAAVFSCVAKMKEEEVAVAPGAEATAAEPEVIGKKKIEGEEEKKAEGGKDAKKDDKKDEKKK